MDDSATMKAGFLFLKFEGVHHSHATKLEDWTKRWVVLRKESSRGPTRIEHFAKEKDVIKGKGKEVIALHRVVAVNDISHRSRMNAFEIKYTETHTACQTLLCGGTAETEKRAWQACVESLLPSSQRTIQHEHMKERQAAHAIRSSAVSTAYPHRPAPSSSHVHPAVVHHASPVSPSSSISSRPVSASQTVPREQKHQRQRVASMMLRETRDSEVFRVRIDPNESSSILQLHGDYILSIVDGYKLVLAPLFPTQKIIEWNLAHIRNFDIDRRGQGMKALVIITGRRSSTGHGTFRLLTSRADAAFSFLTRKTQSMVDATLPQQMTLPASHPRTVDGSSLTRHQQLSPRPPSSASSVPSKHPLGFYHEVENDIYDTS